MVVGLTAKLQFDMTRKADRICLGAPIRTPEGKVR